MKSLIHFVRPSHDFLPKYETATKIQIDNSLDLGWKPQDLILATNFPYEYRGVESLIVSDNTYCDFDFTVTLINVIVELFDRKLIRKGEIYWYHDSDVFEAHKITEAELDLGEADIAMAYKYPKPKYDLGSMFFKSSAGDIFKAIQKIAYKHKVYEEDTFMALYTNNLLWATEGEVPARTKFIPLDFPGMENMHKRVKQLNVSYNFWEEILGEAYKIAIKPIKLPHIHYAYDRILDSFMYGKNNQKTVLMPERLIKIFHKHGINGVRRKKMKNLMVYTNPEKNFFDKMEELVKRQIDNSLKLGWKKKNIVLVTNFPYEYKEVKAMQMDNLVQAPVASAIFQLINQRLVKEAELWWYHDLDVFQLHPMDSSQIDLVDTVAGFTKIGPYKFDMGSFFFRTDSDKLFEWMRNRAYRLRSDEATALESLAAVNYRNINELYKILKLDKMFTHQ